MPHLLHYHPPPPPILTVEPVPPIPPRTRSRPSSRQQQQPLPQSSLSQSILIAPNHQRNHFFRLDDLPSPDREWQLLENIGDGTYGEVFRVSSQKIF
jgi:hypothetical protein